MVTILPHQGTQLTPSASIAGLDASHGTQELPVGIFQTLCLVTVHGSLQVCHVLCMGVLARHAGTLGITPLLLLTLFLTGHERLEVLHALGTPLDKDGHGVGADVVWLVQTYLILNLFNTCFHLHQGQGVEVLANDGPIIGSDVPSLNERGIYLILALLERENLTTTAFDDLKEDGQGIASCLAFLVDRFVLEEEIYPTLFGQFLHLLLSWFQTVTLELGKLDELVLFNLRTAGIVTEYAKPLLEVVVGEYEQLSEL